MKTPIISLKRAYTPASPDDGFRVLVDRLWPQGISRQELHCDLWAKDIAPSTQLRKWFHADPQGRWQEFQKRYLAELEASPDFAALKEKLSAYPHITLVYASRDTQHNNAQIVEEGLEDQEKEKN